MCGIVGYIGPQNATPIILGGLKRLEYRGYDSAGLAVLENGHIEVRRDVGKLSRLVEVVAETPLKGNLGIGHTRWATHGEPSARNAHPHMGMTGEVVVVHNGIVENYLELRAELRAEGVVFTSDTDTEVIVHLVERFLSGGGGLLDAAKQAFKQLKGAHAIVLFSSREPDKIIAARIGNAGGVVIGLGKGEMFVASDMPAILEHTRRIVFLESRQLAVITRQSLDIQTLEGKKVAFELHDVAWDPVSAEKGEYRHFMHKEIHEQVRSLTDTIAGRVNFDEGRIQLPELKLTNEKARRIKKICIIACGTAYHAGLVGKVQIERIARIPVEVDIASEFRYRDPIVDEDTVVLAISQSGETADTLAAMEEARQKGATLWAIVNVIGSQAMRIADGAISMQTGPEIGVASTKAFTAPLVDLYMLAVYLADLRGILGEKERRNYVSSLALVPDLVGRCLDREIEVLNVGKTLVRTNHCLYLGRGINMPIAYEGALKLKEISYIHAEGYPAGEMKHGPIALVDKDMQVIAVATEGDSLVPSLADQILWVPETPWLLSPVVTVIPLQLLAYHIAALRGLDVDQPRNLAKSVTVE